MKRTKAMLEQLLISRERELNGYMNEVAELKEAIKGREDSALTIRDLTQRCAISEARIDGLLYAIQIMKVYIRDLQTKYLFPPPNPSFFEFNEVTGEWQVKVSSAEESNG